MTASDPISRASGTVLNAIVPSRAPPAKPSASDMSSVVGCRQIATRPPSGEAIPAAPASL